MLEYIIQLFKGLLNAEPYHRKEFAVFSLIYFIFISFLYYLLYTINSEIINILLYIFFILPMGYAFLMAMFKRFRDTNIGKYIFLFIILALLWFQIGLFLFFLILLIYPSE